MPVYYSILCTDRYKKKTGIPCNLMIIWENHSSAGGGSGMI
jgi:hypothetical protein